MEQMIKRARLARRRLDDAIISLFGGSMLVSSLLSGLMGLLLAAYTPAEGIAPLGVGCAAGVWYAGISPYFACAGAFIGHLICGNYPYAAAAFALAVTIAALERFVKPGRVYRLLAAFGAEMLALCVCMIFTSGHLAFALAGASVSVLSAVILGHGIKAAGMLDSTRELSDAELLSLAASAGMVTLSLGNASILGQSPAMIFAGTCSLLIAYRCGAASAAFAVAAGAGRALVTGGDMHFIAVIAASSLIAASLKGLGKAAVTLGFAASNLLFCAALRGTAVFSVFETLFCCAAFMLLPKSLYMPAECSGSPARSGVKASSCSSMQYSISGLAEVLRGLARVYGDELGEMLLCISDTLQRTVSGTGIKKRAEYRIDAGCAAEKMQKSPKSGDSVIIRSINGDTLLCLSDGMGSGEAAGRQSRETVDLLCDLLTVGFDVQAASRCINRLMTLRAMDDMYSTLDAMLIDPSDGTARLIKLGAAPSFVIRGGRLFTLYAENLPLGITCDSEAQPRRTALKRGDTVIMMTDGAADGLGSSLAAVLLDCGEKYADPHEAAAEVLRAACANGADDDMTVIWARLG